MSVSVTRKPTGMPSIDRPLRPTPPFQTRAPPIEPAAEDVYRFSPEMPIIVSETERVLIPEETYSGEETDEEDHEVRIQTSWHHRAMLNDARRRLYRDYQDTDWLGLERKERRMRQSLERRG